MKISGRSGFPDTKTSLGLSMSVSRNPPLNQIVLLVLESKLKILITVSNKMSGNVEICYQHNASVVNVTAE